MEKTKNGITEGVIWKQLLLFFFPILIGTFFQQLYNTVDTIIVGQFVGTEALAAVGTTGTVINLLVGFFVGVASGATVIISQFYGGHRDEDVSKAVHTAAAMALGCGVLLTVVGIALSPMLLRMMGTPEDVMDYALTYMRIYFAVMIPNLIYNIGSGVLRAVGDSRRPLYFLIAACLTNIVLDVVLVIGLNMGVAGAAWATVLSQLLSAILCTIVGLRKYPVFRTCRADFAGSRIAAARHLRVGFLMGFQMSVMCIGQLVVQACVNKLGTAAVAGYTAATKVDQLSVLVNTAYQIAISGYAAQNYGAHRFDRIREGVRASLIQLESVNVLMCAAMLLARRAVVSLFIDAPTEEVISYAGGYLTAVAPFYIVLGLLIVYRSAVQSMGNSTAPFLACVVELVMRIGGALGLSRVLGYTGVCFSSPLAWIGATALLIPFYRREMRKGKNIAA